MFTRRKNSSNARRAVSLIWVALSGLLFIGFVGLAADTSYVYLTAEQLQWVADASALAGARICATETSPYTQTRNSTVNLAAANKAGGLAISLARNDANAVDGEVVVGRYSTSTQVFTPVPPATGLTPNAVKVVAKRSDGSMTGNLPLIFGRVFGANHANISRDATAMIGGTGAGLIVLNQTQSCSFDMGGNTTLNLFPTSPQTCDDGAGIQVNSSSATGACAGNSSTILTTVLGVNGGYSGAATITAGACTNSVVDLVDDHNGVVIPDPLGCSGGTCVPEPITSDFTIRTSPANGGTVTILPGWYQNGIQRTGGVLTMQPGVYIIGNNQNNNANTLQLNGNSQICGKGVMFFIKAGQIQITGGSGLKQLDPIKLSPPSNYFCNAAFTNPNGLQAKWDGIIIFQSRTNTSQAFIAGSSSLQMTGTVYFPNNLVRVSGAGFSLGTQVICDQFQLQGGANVTINYDGRNPANGIGRATLVE